MKTNKIERLNAIFQDTPMGKIYPIWHSSETELHEVPRWIPYLEKNPGLRKQTTGRHGFSFGLAAQIALVGLSRYANYDRALMALAFKLHDLPEGFLGTDTPAPKKKDEDDLREYLAFKERFAHIPYYEELEKAYLIQFAHKLPDIFPSDVKEVMKKLNKYNALEVRVFPALEAWEYGFYAYEGFASGDEVILTHVLRNQIPRLREMSLRLPGFRQEVFTPKYELWATSFIEAHKHVPTQEEYFKE